jgi:hypothetical protein
VNYKAAFSGDYTDLRFIKSRKVCQITVEIPIEAGAAFVAAFGTPDPSTGVPVALARLTGSAGPLTAGEGKETGEGSPPVSEPEKPKGGKLAQRAGILCNDPAFRKFIAANLKIDRDPADYIRWFCGVNSRAQLDHNEYAANAFFDLEGRYKAWRQL